MILEACVVIQVELIELLDLLRQLIRREHLLGLHLHSLPVIEKHSLEGVFLLPFLASRNERVDLSSFLVRNCVGPAHRKLRGLLPQPLLDVVDFPEFVAKLVLV